jgi:YD repeat-containing protein
VSGGVSTHVYDARGRLVRIEEDHGVDGSVERVHRYYYNLVGNLTREESCELPQERCYNETLYAYDTLGRRIKRGFRNEVQYLGLWRYLFNWTGWRLIRWTAGRRWAFHYSYNDAGHPVREEIETLDHGRRPDWTTWEYDQHNWLINTEVYGGWHWYSTAYFSYDGAGRLRQHLVYVETGYRAARHFTND